MSNTIKLYLKDPDGVSTSIEDYIEEHGKCSNCHQSIVTEEEISKHISKWVKFEEFVTIEINLDTKEAKVLENE